MADYKSTTLYIMDVKKANFLKALEYCLGVVQRASEQTKTPRSTHYNWYNSDEQYRAAVDDIQNIAIDFVESELFKQIKDGNVTAMIFYLKTKAKNRGYIERAEVDHSSKGEKINVVLNIDTEDLKNSPIE